MLQMYILKRSKSRFDGGVVPPYLLEQGLAAMATPDGMPILVSDEAGYCHEVNRFLRELPGAGCPSPGTWSSYAQDLVVLANFLQGRNGRSLLEADADDLKAFHGHRRVKGAVVAVETWNRGVAAIQKFYEWAVGADLIATVPYELRKVIGRTRYGRASGGAVSRLRETAVAREEVKCVSLDDYLFFRDVGLRGLSPNGDASGRGRVRNALRNVAFAELLVTTGPRLEEASSILRREVPSGAKDGRCNRPLALGRYTCKRSRSRRLHVPDRVLTLIRNYVDDERSMAIYRLNCGADRLPVDDFVLASAFTGADCRLPDGALAAFDDMKPGFRRSLFVADDPEYKLDPAMLWCTETGRPIDAEAFEKAFARASVRCRRWRPHLSISPHTLRHTFAVQMLSELIRQAIGTILDLRKLKRGEDDGVYQRLLINPLRQLSKMLGHRSEATTYRYLTYLETANELVDAAIDSWSQASAAQYIQGAAK